MDYSQRFMLPGRNVRGQLIRLSKSWTEIQATTDYPIAIAQQLGQALAAVTALGSTIKLDGSIILQVQGDGPMDTLVAQANNAGEIRGLASWDLAAPITDDFLALVGAARAVITIDGANGKRYQGIVEVKGNTLALTLDDYFTQSEQLCTRVWLACDERHAAAFLLQQLPSEPLPEQQNHDRQDWEHCVILAQTLTDEELLTVSAENVLNRLYHQDEVRLFDAEPVRFYCRCSREKVANAIIQLGQADAEALIQERKIVEANCEFCNQKHRFDAVDIAALFHSTNPSSSPVLPQ